MKGVAPTVSQSRLRDACGLGPTVTRPRLIARLDQLLARDSLEVPVASFAERVAATAAWIGESADHPECRQRKYWPALEGVRGLAALAVVVFHGQLAFGHQGEFGVDVFFVLSGFLITTMLLSEYQTTGRISLRSFYLRRLRRLYPALVCVCLVALILSPGKRVAQGVIASLSYAYRIGGFTQAIIRSL
jgi:hypothetical protein